jgi:hypothetical protein
MLRGATLAPLWSETEANREAADEGTDGGTEGGAGEDSVTEPGWPPDEVSAILPSVVPWRSRGSGGEWDDIVGSATGWFKVLSGAPPGDNLLPGCAVG